MWPLDALKKISLFVIKNPLSLLYTFAGFTSAEKPYNANKASNTLQTFDGFYNTGLCLGWAIHDSQPMKRVLQNNINNFCKARGCAEQDGCSTTTYYRMTNTIGGRAACDTTTCQNNVLFPCALREALRPLEHEICETFAPRLSQSRRYYNMRCLDEGGQNLGQNKRLNACMHRACTQYRRKTCPPSPWWWPDSMISYCDTVLCPSGKLKPETAEKAEKHKNKCYRQYCRNSPAHNKRNTWLKYNGGYG